VAGHGLGAQERFAGSLVGEVERDLHPLARWREDVLADERLGGREDGVGDVGERVLVDAVGVHVVARTDYGVGVVEVGVGPLVDGRSRGVDQVVRYEVVACQKAVPDELAAFAGGKVRHGRLPVVVAIFYQRENPGLQAGRESRRL
jgi:hypothetical protein